MRLRPRWLRARVRACIRIPRSLPHSCSRQSALISQLFRAVRMRANPSASPLRFALRGALRQKNRPLLSRRGRYAWIGLGTGPVATPSASCVRTFPQVAGLRLGRSGTLVSGYSCISGPMRQKAPRNLPQSGYALKTACVFRGKTTDARIGGHPSGRLHLGALAPYAQPSGLRLCATSRAGLSSSRHTPPA